MDSLTQIALGAGLGAAIGGKKYGKKSALIGAFLGTFPDLDVIFFAGNTNPVEAMTEHRGFSHSILFAILATPLLAWIISQIKYFNVAFKDREIHLMIFLCLITHMVLDAMTIYGTQLLWPLKTPPIGVGSIFIIDLLYTLPLLVGVIWFLCNRSLEAARTGLVLSTLYLVWCVGAQQYVKHHATRTYDGEYAQILVQPTPFNSLLWRVLVMENENYKVGYLSLFDQDKDIDYKSYALNKNLIEPIKNHYAPSRLEWFNKGYYAVKKVGNDIVISDLRMGLEPDQYVFQFVVGEKQGNQIVAVPNRRFESERNLSRLSLIWQRIWDETISLHP